MEKVVYSAIILLIGSLFGYIGTITYHQMTLPNTSNGVVIHTRPTAIVLSGDSSQITVYVHGEINASGVYELSSDERIEQAIFMAGGFLDTADTRSVNLASPLVDGMQIYVPSIGESPAVLPTAVAITENGSGELLGLNSATVDALQNLPGIGPATAEKIIQKRTELGRFEAVEELLLVSGIGEKKFEQLVTQVTID